MQTPRTGASGRTPDRSSSVPPIAAVPPGTPRPRVSVVTATFNARDALETTLASVAAQSWRDLEHVVIDGGSTDGTAAVLESAGAQVRWLSEKDGGIADAMNKGVAMARGEWIIVLHAGDTFVDADSLAGAMSRVSDGIDILTCGILYGGRKTDTVMVHRNPRQRLTFKALLHQGTLCRRTVFERLGGFDTGFRVGMDYEFFLRARAEGARFGRDPLILARMDDSGVSAQRDWPALSRRFAEEKRAQLAHCPNLWMRAVYALYWPPYLAYRRIRARMSKAGSVD